MRRPASRPGPSATAWRRVAPLALLLGIACPVATSASAAPPGTSPVASPPAVDPAEAEGRAIARALDEAYPDRPEWVDMLVDIVQGSQLGPGEGWFRRAVAQTRFGWKAASARYDRDRDGRITRDELGAPAADFARLDRDRDGTLTEADFDFSAHALTPSPGMLLFVRADRDGNGKLTRDELLAYFDAVDGGKLGFLSLGDLQQALPAPSSRPPAPTPPPADAKPSGPSKETLIRGLFRQEIGSLQPGPALDESAPDFTLAAQDGRGKVTLSKRIGPKPVVLVFGNFTCGPFRSQAGNVEKLYRMYKDRAEFLMIYVREAHPTDGWRMESNDRVEVALAQPRTYDERVKVAQTCAARLQLGFPMLVDTIDDAVGARYSGMPSRLYLIDGQGKIAYKSGRGPFGFKPAELEQSLLLLLNEKRASRDARADRDTDRSSDAGR